MKKTKKWMFGMCSLALLGCLMTGGQAMAAPAAKVNVDASTANLPDKVQSEHLKVDVKTPLINEISNVVYEQVPMRGYPNVAMKMDILQPKSKEKLPAYASRGGRLCRFVH